MSHRRDGLLVVRRAGAVLVGLCLVVGSIQADAQTQGSILHEFLPPDPSEDVSFATTTLDGDLPAAIQTPSGVATAPDPRRPPDNDHVYSGSSTDDSPDATYEPDRDTRRPNVENYDDPFSPATAPFKRLRAYDAVDPDYSLRVRDRGLVPLAVGGSVASGDEPFYGDISVDITPEQPVRIPTVGPGARILKMHANPTSEFDLARDGADNWFIRGKSRIRVRLVVELAIPRATFGSPFGDPEWNQIEGGVPQQPARHHTAFQEVAKSIGISRSMRPREVVGKMVDYFRGFAPSNDPPKERDDIYLDLALSKKGVCRHRAFAFLVTSLNIGIPTRMVVNEAHAWVEVFDATLWHRIDLGGAALNLEQESDPGRPPYVPPPDPFAWPNNRDSGEDLAQRAREQQRDQTPDPGGPQPSPGNGSSLSTSATPNLSPSAATDDPQRPTSEVVVAEIDKDVRRGLPFHIKGEVTSPGGPCAHVRVDVFLVSAELPAGVAVGSLSTNDRGIYDGAVVIPRDFAVGEYDLIVVTAGDSRCSAAQSK